MWWTAAGETALEPGEQWCRQEFAMYRDDTADAPEFVGQVSSDDRMRST